jgi:hypothetical protein
LTLLLLLLSLLLLLLSLLLLSLLLLLLLFCVRVCVLPDFEPLPAVVHALLVRDL